MPAIDIAHSIPDIGDDGIALRLGLHLYPLRRLVFLHRPVIPVGSRPKLGPAAKSRMIEIENGRVPLLVRPACNENHRDAVELCRLEQLPRRLDGLGARLEDPSVEPAPTRRQHVSKAIGHEAEIMGRQNGPIGYGLYIGCESKPWSL